VRDETTSKRHRRPGLIALLALTMTAGLAVSAAPTVAAVKITDYKISSNLLAFPTVPSAGPSSFQGGANVDAGSYTTFDYTPPGNTTDDLKTALTNFSAGLLGNPESVPKCPEAALQAGGDACPPGSQIGTSRLDVQFAGSSPPAPIAGFTGKLFNAELLGNEPGRLASVTVVGAPPAIVSSIPFYITPRGGGDYGLTGVLTDISNLDATALGNLQVEGLSFLINGSTNNYVRNPTSCRAQASSGQAIGYQDPATTVDGPPYTFTTTGCDTVPFGPTVSMSVGDPGTTKFNGNPPLTFKISQPAGTQADIQNVKVLLPIELNTNNPAYKLCTQAQADANACPANSKFGGAVATSPFLHDKVSGPVYLIQQTASSLPGLLIDLNGRVHVKIQTSTTLVGGKQIQSLTANSPQLPISDFSLQLNGGKNTGVFLNRSDLCFASGSTSKFKTVTAETTLDGWNGKSAGKKTVTVQVNGCGPAVSDKLTGATGGRPSLSVTATKPPANTNMKELTLKLSSNLRLVKSKLGSGVSGTASANLGKASFTYVNSHTLKVTGLPAAGAAKVALKLRKGAIRISTHSKRLLNRGKSRTFKVKARQTPVSGKPTSTLSKFKVKGKKRK
jgi:hypothetical protein